MLNPVADKLVRDPIYKQLNDALRGLIDCGEFRSGDKFLSEREIGERFCVSRATANKALSTLVAEGILSFRKGVGTFVKRYAPAFDFAALSSFTEQARRAGRLPAARVLTAAFVAPGELDAQVAARLGRDDGAYYLERLRFADERPVLLERRYVSARHCPGLLEHDLTGSLHTLWLERYGLRIEYVRQSIRGVQASEGDAACLTITPGALCLLSARLGRLAPAQPLWCERSLYRADAFEFRVAHGSEHSDSVLQWSLVGERPAGSPGVAKLPTSRRLR